MPKIIIDLSEEQYKGLKNIPYGSIASKIIYDKMKQGVVIVDGEYIKKEDALKKAYPTTYTDEWHCSKTERMISESDLNSLPTYSIPPVVTINVPEEKIQEFIHSKLNVVLPEQLIWERDYAKEQYSADIEKIQTEILEKMADYVASGYANSAEDFEEYSRIVIQTFNEHIGGKDK